MWTPADRALVGDFGSGQALTDDQFRLLEPLIPPAKPGGRPRTTDIRNLLDGLFYLVRTGCQWRHLPPPPAFPPWRTVYGPTWTVPSENSFYVSCLERPSRVFALHPRPPVGGRATKVWERRRRNNGRSRAGTHAPCRPNGGGVGCRGDRAGISVFSVAESRGRLSVGGLLGVLHVRPVKRKLFQALGTRCFHHRPPASWTEGQPAQPWESQKV
jgi:transposase